MGFGLMLRYLEERTFYHGLIHGQPDTNITSVKRLSMATVIQHLMEEGINGCKCGDEGRTLLPSVRIVFLMFKTESENSGILTIEDRGSPSTYVIWLILESSR
jgi:hypothetical protein